MSRDNEPCEQPGIYRNNGPQRHMDVIQQLGRNTSPYIPGTMTVSWHNSRLDHAARPLTIYIFTETRERVALLLHRPYLQPVFPAP